jgi:two-component system sensor histidine kinase DegS
VLTAFDSRKLQETERALRADRQALRQFIRTQERERQMISYEIHDGLAQYLAGALMQLETVGHAIRSRDIDGSGNFLDAFEEGLRLVRAATAESRRLINGLRPPMLDELGIVEAIESLVAEAKADIPSVNYVGPTKLARLDANVETAIFRIVQESLTNSRKHSKARSAKVVLELRGENDIAAIVEDDGIGFVATDVPEGCFGLEGIRQRARLFGREATIESAPGRSTRIEVVLPKFPALERPDASRKS